MNYRYSSIGTSKFTNVINKLRKRQIYRIDFFSQFCKTFINKNRSSVHQFTSLCISKFRRPVLSRGLNNIFCYDKSTNKLWSQKLNKRELSILCSPLAVYFDVLFIIRNNVILLPFTRKRIIHIFRLVLEKRG